MEGETLKLLSAMPSLEWIVRELLAALRGDDDNGPRAHRQLM